MPKLADLWRLGNLGRLEPGSALARLFSRLKDLERILGILHIRVENSAHLPGEDGGQVLYGGGSLALHGGTPGPPATTGPVSITGSAVTVEGATVINETGADADVRVEGDTTTHLLFTDASINRVGINEAAPAARFHVTDHDAASFTSIFDQYGAPSRLIARRVNGARGTESAVLANDQLGNLNFRGWHSSGAFSGGRAALAATATENWTSTANGAQVSISTTPNGSTTPVTRLLVDHGGNVGVNATSFGASAAKVLAIGSGTAPTSSPADTGQLWVADSVPGSAEFYTRNEAGAVERHTGLAARTTSAFSKTSDTTLADVSDLTRIVEAGRSYEFAAVLRTTSDAAGGVNAAIAGTATATIVEYDVLTINAGAITQGRATALGTGAGGVTAVTAALVLIFGFITVNAGGTLVPQFAQNASAGVASIVRAGSTFKLRPVA